MNPLTTNYNFNYIPNQHHVSVYPQACPSHQESQLQEIGYQVLRLASTEM
jgi:hypothetical protein